MTNNIFKAIMKRSMLRNKLLKLNSLMAGKTMIYDRNICIYINKYIYIYILYITYIYTYIYVCILYALHINILLKRHLIFI